MVIALNSAGAQALRELANSLPVAVANILSSTERLVSVYQSVSEKVGVHSEDFRNMLMLIKSAQEKSAEAIEVLPPMMRKTAADIDDYVATHRTVSGNEQA